MSRLVKQIIYAFVYLIFWSLFFGAVYLIFLPPQSCTNNRHDWGEEGVDCGGKCSRVCVPEDIASISVMEGPYLFNQNIVSALVRVKNSNSEFAASLLNYHFDYYEGDKLLARRSGSDVVYSEEIKYIYDFWDTAELDRVTRVDFAVDGTVWTENKNLDRPALRIIQSSPILESDGSISISGRLMNNDSRDMGRVSVLAVLFSDLRLSGFSKTDLGGVRAGEEMDFRIVHPGFDRVDLSRTQLYISARSQ